MSHQRHPHTPDAADCWLAFRYLTGELNETEWAAFESRLAQDPELQFALAETVKLTTGVSHLDRSATHFSTRPSRISRQSEQFSRSTARRMVGLAAAVVCLLAFGVLLQPTVSIPIGMTGTEEDNDGLLRAVAPADLPSIISLWSSLDPEEIVEEEEFVTSNGTSLNDDTGDELHVPSWLLLAVREESGNAAPDDFPADKPL